MRLIVIAIIAMWTIMLVGCAHTHPPLACYAATSSEGRQALICQPITPGQIDNSPIGPTKPLVRPNA